MAMHYVIQLNLGSEAEEQIRSLWRNFASEGIGGEELVFKGTPHVTVMSSAPFALADIQGRLISLARQFEPFDITFSHIGVFPGSPAVLFLGVTHTAVLTSLHRRLYALISPGAEVPDFAQPDVFVFHCTLGYIQQPSDLPRAVELAAGATLPHKVQVRGFEVVECHGATCKKLATCTFDK